MTLRTRLASVERGLPRAAGKVILIRSGARSSAKPIPGGYAVRVPCPWNPGAMTAALTSAQRALIGPNDRVFAVRFEGGRVERVRLTVRRS